MLLRRDIFRRITVNPTLPPMDLAVIVLLFLSFLGACFTCLWARGHWLIVSNETCYRTHCGCLFIPSIKQYLTLGLVFLKSGVAAFLMCLSLRRKKKSEEDEDYTQSCSTILKAYLVHNSSSLLCFVTFAIIASVSLASLYVFGWTHHLDNCPQFTDRAGQFVSSSTPVDVTLGWNLQWACLAGPNKYLELEQGRQDVLDALKPKFHFDEWTGDVSATMPQESVIVKLVYTCIREHVQFSCLINFHVLDSKRGVTPKPTRQSLAPAQRHQENQLELIIIFVFSVIFGSLCLFLCGVCLVPLFCLCCCCSALAVPSAKFGEL